MPDNLTERFKKQLEKQGVVATDAQITSYLQQKGLMEPEQNQLMPLSNSIQQRAMAYDITPEADDKIDLLQGVAAGAWSLFDVAALGIPGLAGLTPEYVQYEKLGPAGKVGRVLGEAGGFLLPLKAISSVTRGAASIARGSKAGISRAAKIVEKTAGKAGVSGSAAARVIRNVGADKHVRLNVLPRYALKGESLDDVGRVMKEQFEIGLRTEFPTLRPEQLRGIADDAVNAVRGEARHINSVGQWLEARLATRFPDRGKITKYAADAAEMSLSFGLYNVITDATRSVITGSEFTPTHDVWDAMKFSAFLPAVHMIPTFGKEAGKQLFATRKHMNEMLKSFKARGPEYYDTLARQGKTQQLNGLLQFIARGTKYEAAVSAAARPYKHADLPAKEAAAMLNKIIKKGNLDRTAREFISEAGSDIVGSLPRMMVGALYFNSNVLMDRDLLRNIPKEEMWTHLLVGALFTKRHKPLYQEKFPTLNKFDRKLELLRTLGIDADALGDYARGMSQADQIGMASAGIKDNVEAMEMVRIFDSPEVTKEANDPKKAVGEQGLLNYDLVKQAHDIHNLHQISANSLGDAGKKRIDIKNLSHGTLEKIEAQLKSIKINTEGETLTEANFPEWKEGFQKALSEGPAEVYLEAIAAVADILQIPTDGSPTVDGKLRVGRMENWRGTDLVLDSTELAQWIELRDTFERWGYLETFEEVTPRKAKDVVDATNKKVVFDRIAAVINSVPKILEKANYEEGVVSDIAITDNGFLDTIRHYKNEKRKDSLFRIISGDKNMTEEESRIRRSLEETLGETIPSQLGKIQDLIRIKLTKEEKRDPAKRDTKALIEDKLHDIVHMWSISKSDGRKRLDLTLEQAQSIVGSMEAEGLLFDNNLYRHDGYEKVNKHFWERILQSPDIGAKELGIVRIGIDSGLVGVSTGGGGRPRLEWPDREVMAQALARERESTIDDPDVVADLKKYDVILNNILSIKGKFIDTGTRMIDPSSMTEQGYSAFIHDAYIMAEKYDKMVTDRVRQLEEVYSKNDAINVQIKSLVEMFKDDKGKYRTLKQLI